MKTAEEVLQAVETKQAWSRGTCSMIESRDLKRLISYFPEKITEWGFQWSQQVLDDGIPESEEFNEENIVRDFRKDLELAIEKAEDERGISSSLMHEVVGMYLFIMGDDIDNYSDYGSNGGYGLQCFREVREKYFQE